MCTISLYFHDIITSFFWSIWWNPNHLCCLFLAHIRNLLPNISFPSPRGQLNPSYFILRGGTSQGDHLLSPHLPLSYQKFVPGNQVALSFHNASWRVCWTQSLYWPCVQMDQPPFRFHFSSSVQRGNCTFPYLSTFPLPLFWGAYKERPCTPRADLLLPPDRPVRVSLVLSILTCGFLGSGHTGDIFSRLKCETRTTLQ